MSIADICKASDVWYSGAKNLAVCVVAGLKQRSGETSHPLEMVPIAGTQNKGQKTGW